MYSTKNSNEEDESILRSEHFLSRGKNKSLYETKGGVCYNFDTQDFRKPLQKVRKPSVKKPRKNKDIKQELK